MAFGDRSSQVALGVVERIAYRRTGVPGVIVLVDAIVVGNRASDRRKNVRQSFAVESFAFQFASAVVQEPMSEPPRSRFENLRGLRHVRQAPAPRNDVAITLRVIAAFVDEHVQSPSHQYVNI